MGGNCKVKKNDFMHDVCGVEGILSLPFLFRPNMLMLWTFFKDFDDQNRSLRRNECEPISHAKTQIEQKSIVIVSKYYNMISKHINKIEILDIPIIFNIVDALENSKRMNKFRWTWVWKEPTTLTRPGGCYLSKKFTSFYCIYRGVKILCTQFQMYTGFSTRTTIELRKNLYISQHSHPIH